MTNGRIPKQTERKEPQLSPITPFDSLVGDDGPRLGTSAQGSDFTDSPKLPPVAEQNYTSRPAASSSKKTAPAPKAKTGLLWSGVFILLFCVIGMGSYGFLELERLKGMQRAMLERVNVLAAKSDQIGDKLTASGGQIQETQTSLSSRVATLEANASERFEAIQKSLQLNQSKVAGLDKQLTEGLQAQAKSGQNIAGLKAQLTDDLAKQRTEFNAALANQQKLVASFQAELEDLQADLKQETVGLGQSMQILREELADAPADRMSKLQDQFATYMQSVDQFRQQTNASLNDLSSQLRVVSRSVEQGAGARTGIEASPSTRFDSDASSFGVQPVN